MTELLDDEPVTDLREVLWRVRTHMELPEGFRAEIIEAGEDSGCIEVSHTGPHAHARAANRLRNAVDAHLGDGPYAVRFGIDIVDGRHVWCADAFIALEDDVENGTCEYGVAASEVPLVAEVVAPGHEERERDRVRKRRAYARAGIPVYVLIDDYDLRGTVTVFTVPVPTRPTTPPNTASPTAWTSRSPKAPPRVSSSVRPSPGPRATTADDADGPAPPPRERRAVGMTGLPGQPMCG
ncbi:Uma2 family endonuclease [Streptomyces chrestomyceticus]|uniref:Uma2 family endonuclease n=1 Tax=Streptomyces chrestomyceticus TaxID=68185 RepID=UPI0037B7AD93